MIRCGACATIGRLSLREMIGDQWFQKLSAETCAKIYLCKAKEYMSMLDELRAVINGGHLLGSTGTFSFVSNNQRNKCPSTEGLRDYGKQLCLGIDRTCKDCTFAKKLCNGTY